MRCGGAKDQLTNAAPLQVRGPAAWFIRLAFSRGELDPRGNDPGRHSMEYEAVVVSLRSRKALRVHHELDRLNPLARRGDSRIGGRGRPHTETNREHSGGNGKHGDLAHLSSPVQSGSRRWLKPFDGEQYAGPWLRPL
jgi:hypothetical protein